MTSYCIDWFFRILETLAHLAIELVTRLFIHSVRRQSSWHYQIICCLNANHVTWWTLAWSSLDFCSLGALHSIYLVVERLLKNKIHIKINALNGIFLAALTFTLVNFTWVFFRAREFSTAKNMISSMLYMNVDGEKILQTFDIVKVMVVITILFLVHWLMRNTTIKKYLKKHRL